MLGKVVFCFALFLVKYTEHFNCYVHIPRCYAHAQCQVAISTVHLQQVLIFPHRNSVPAKHEPPLPPPGLAPTVFLSVTVIPPGTSRCTHTAFVLFH